MSAPISALPAPAVASTRGKPGASDGGAAFGSVLEGTAASQRSSAKRSASEQGAADASASAAVRSESSANERSAAERGVPVASAPGATLPTVDAEPTQATDATELATTLPADAALVEGSQTVPSDGATLHFATPGDTDAAAGAAAGELDSAGGDGLADSFAGAPGVAERGFGEAAGGAAGSGISSGQLLATQQAAAAAPPAPTTPVTGVAAAGSTETLIPVGADAGTPTELGASTRGAAGRGMPLTGAASPGHADGSQSALPADPSQRFATPGGDVAAAGAATGGSGAGAVESGQTRAAAVSPATVSTVAPAQAQPSVVPSQPVSPATPSAAAAQAQAPTFATQVAGPVFSLASAGKGEHVMTVTVTPENLGPVTVRAIVGAESVRVELFAPTDAGRDALRAIMPDLRRDLAATGMSGSLDLSSDNAPAGRGDDAPGRERAAGQSSAASERRIAEPVPTSPAPVVYGGAPTIDVMA